MLIENFLPVILSTGLGLVDAGVGPVKTELSPSAFAVLGFIIIIMLISGVGSKK